MLKFTPSLLHTFGQCSDWQAARNVNKKHLPQRCTNSSIRNPYKQTNTLFS